MAIMRDRSRCCAVCVVGLLFAGLLVHVLLRVRVGSRVEQTQVPIGPLLSYGGSNSISMGADNSMMLLERLCTGRLDAATMGSNDDCYLSAAMAIEVS